MRSVETLGKSGCGYSLKLVFHGLFPGVGLNSFPDGLLVRIDRNI